MNFNVKNKCANGHCSNISKLRQSAEPVRAPADQVIFFPVLTCELFSSWILWLFFQWQFWTAFYKTGWDYWGKRATPYLHLCGLWIRTTIEVNNLPVSISLFFSFPLSLTLTPSVSPSLPLSSPLPPPTSTTPLYQSCSIQEVSVIASGSLLPLFLGRYLPTCYCARIPLQTGNTLNSQALYSNWKTVWKTRLSLNLFGCYKQLT